jgi:hypothetical protein
MELPELIERLTNIRDRTNLPDRDILTIALIYLEDEEKQSHKIICPGCHGSGEWETECCDGSRGCSCHGERVPMGRCYVCNGTGYVIEGKYDPMANCNSIKGMLYAGSGLRY